MKQYDEAATAFRRYVAARTGEAANAPMPCCGPAIAIS
jgi:hypothetical protein